MKISRKTTKKLILFFKIFFFIAVLFGVIYFFGFLLKSNQFKVQNISCSINNFPCQEEINLFSELNNKNIFIVDSAKIIKKIKNSNLFIKDLIIKKILPDKLTVTIITRKTQAQLTKDGQVFYEIDDENIIFKKVFEQQPELPLINTNSINFNLMVGLTITDEQIIKAILISQELKTNSINFMQIIIKSNNTVTVNLSPELLINLLTTKSISSQVDSLQFILRQSKIEGKLPVIIDLRFDKPVLKY